MIDSIKIQEQISKYYTEKVSHFGPTYKGVDWGTEEAQQISFEQLVKIINSENPSLLDYGCGYGALLNYLNKNNIPVDYSGFDISLEMIEQARMLNQTSDAKWLTSIPENAVFDFVIACGIFSVKLDVSIADWEQHTLQTLERINSISKKGFAFNSLTSYSDAHLMKDYLYYPDPCFLFDFCKKRFSKHVTLLHDYPKYEFTILVRK